MNSPAACFFLIISAAASLALCCSDPDMVLPDFCFFTSVSILVGIVGKYAQIRTYLTGQLGLSLLAGLVTLVAAGHFCGEWAEAWFMFL